MSNLARIDEKRQLRLQAELFTNDISLGSYVTDGEDRLIIGSSKRADLVVPHQAISHIHAMLRITDKKEILLYDLGSEKGTFVSGKKIVERQLMPGEFFEIGEHKVKVNLLQPTEGELLSERGFFWKSQGTDYLEVLCLESGVVHTEKSLGKNGKLMIGNRHQEILMAGLNKGSVFIARKTEGKTHCAEGMIPAGYMAEIYDERNQVVKKIEKELSPFSIHEKEKVRLVSANGEQEILIFWRGEGARTKRYVKDSESDMLKKSMAACLGLASLILAVTFVNGPKKEEVVETTVPKTSYFRLSTDSAPAPQAADASDQPAEGSPAENNQNQQAGSKVANISSTLSKLFNKKSTLTAENMQEAISNNGNQTARNSNVKNANMKTEEINAGAIGGGAANVNAISNGLSSGSGGKTGSLNGFANGKGGSIGTLGGSGFGGKGFDMSIGGDEAEAIGGLDKALIAAVVQSNLGQIKHCYERQLIVDPNIFGKVVANWVINKDGGVSTSSVKKSTMNNKAVENCIIGKIKTWSFPKPKGGGQVIVSYPFLFKSLN